MAVEIFYSPHTDDETIGMAGAITRAKNAGATVVLVLVSDNKPSERGIALFAELGVDLVVERWKEFRRAAMTLGVDDLRSLGVSEFDMFANRAVAEEALLFEMEELESEFPGAIHRTVIGAGDKHAETGAGTRAHAVCESCARNFKTLHPDAGVFLHAVYVYSHPLEVRSAPIVVELTNDEMARKREAILAYKVESGSIGYGYRSVPELFDAAGSDPREFMVKL